MAVISNFLWFNSDYHRTFVEPYPGQLEWPSAKGLIGSLKTRRFVSSKDLAMGFLDCLFKKTKRARSGVLSGSDREFIQQEWSKIEELLELGDPSGRKEALIRTDKLLDYALQRIATGETMGERLKNAQNSFPSWSVYNGVWNAHKMRNAIVHEAGFEPPHHIIVNAVEQIKAGLESLGAIRV